MAQLLTQDILYQGFHSDLHIERLRNLYSEVAVVLIDEISMVLNIRLIHIHKRSCEIFGCLET